MRHVLSVRRELSVRHVYRSVFRRWLDQAARRCHKGIRDDAGSVLILTAITLTVLLGFTALVTDAGLLYVHRSSLSNAVDAAALAGVQELPNSSREAEQRAYAYGELNGVDPAAMVVEVSSDRKEIAVQAERRVDLFFARILGIDTADVGARAKARVASVVGYRGAIPLGVEAQEFEYGEQYLLKYGPHSNGGMGSGNFGALAFDDRGANTYEDDLKHGYEGMLRVGDMVSTEPGNMAGPTAEAIKHRIDHDPHTPACRWDSVQPGCNRLVVVPVIEGYDTANGRDTVEIVGFAAFFLEGTTRQDKDDVVIGRFIKMAADGDAGEGGDFGLVAYRLVE